MSLFFFFQAEDGIRDYKVTGVQTCALPISLPSSRSRRPSGRRSPRPRGRRRPRPSGSRRARGGASSRPPCAPRSEERRVGKSVELGGRRVNKKKKRGKQGNPDVATNPCIS